MNDKQPSIAEALSETVAAENDAITAFVDVLEQEQAILKEGSPTDLPSVVAKKDQLSEKLALLAGRRNALLAQAGLSPDRPGMEAFCAQKGSQAKLASQWATTLELASRAKELNRLNGALIGLRMQYNDRVLEALCNTSASQPLYGPDGQSTSAGQRRISDSV